MPLGFANNIFTASSTTAGADWANWDGSKDSTITVNELTNGSNYGRWLGFCDFNDDYGLAFGIENQSGGTADDIVYAKLQNSDDTLTYSGQAVHITTSTSSFSNEKGTIVKTNGGNIYASFDVGSSGRIYSISGSTVTQHTAFSQTRTNPNYNRMFRQPGSNVYSNISGMPTGELVTLTDNGNSSSESTGTETGLRNPGSSGTGMYWRNNSYIIPGFVDKDTPIRLQVDPTPASGSASSANFGICSPQGFVVIGDSKFFSVPFLNFILQEIVPFSSSRRTLTLCPIGAKSAYPLASIASFGQALTHE